MLTFFFAARDMIFEEGRVILPSHVLLAGESGAGGGAGEKERGLVFRLLQA